MVENELREFCEKNKGKKIRVVLTVPSKEWSQNGSLFFLGRPYAYAAFTSDQISSLTVEGDDEGDR